KTDSMVDIAFLEYCLREDLNKRALRVMAVLRPLKLIIENYPQDNNGNNSSEELEAVNNPEDESAGIRRVPFSGELWIERDDFEEIPPPKYFRLFPGNSVRLRYAYIITCTGFDKDTDGNITAVRCTYDPETKGGNAPDNKKVKGTIHWVSAANAVPIEVRLYDYLFNKERAMEVAPRADGTPGEFTDNLNPNSLEVITNAWGEPAINNAAVGQAYQFERLGYFTRDPDTGKDGQPVFNRTVGLRDTWGKIAKKV
ncbi:MAG: glutamine--tRNA ligase, partial [Treponema sp.]|nr:glutamine--tRNA ligase [Treponema sp.]